METLTARSGFRHHGVIGKVIAISAFFTAALLAIGAVVVVFGSFVDGLEAYGLGRSVGLAIFGGLLLGALSYGFFVLAKAFCRFEGWAWIWMVVLIGFGLLASSLSLASLWPNEPGAGWALAYLILYALSAYYLFSNRRAFDFG